MKKVYIVCPANKATGGPELLHQLCNCLNKLGIDAVMYYYGGDKRNPVHENYRHYNNKYEFSMKDNENNIIIVPETRITLLNWYSKAKKIIWWLSVDNYYNSINSKRAKLETIFGLKKFDFTKNSIIHLAQSQYAVNFLKNNNIDNNNIFYLSDYLNHTFIKNALKNKVSAKSPRVLYNPKKGYEFTKKLIEFDDSIEWRELKDLTPQQMSNLMCSSMIYVDFGNHPGKDRIPREAAISGCCVITGKRGSANFFEDVPILDEYKFEEEENMISNIIDKIRYIISNYNEEFKKFDNYREVILKEEEYFKEDVNKIFKKLIDNA